jgi:CheY-like chemotaxis protein
MLYIVIRTTTRNVSTPRRRHSRRNHQAVSLHHGIGARWWLRGTRLSQPIDRPASGEEMIALQRELRPLIPAVAAVCGPDSPPMRFLVRAMHTPKRLEEKLKELRLAKFAIDHLSEETWQRLSAWPDQPEETTSPAAARGAQRDGEKQTSQGQMVLVAVDDSVLYDTAAGILRPAGHGVRRVTDVSAAMKTVDREVPALVIVDLLLRHADGVAFILELLKRGTPVIALCAIRAETSDPGLAFLSRTFDREGLLTAVAHVLSGSARL